MPRMAKTILIIANNDKPGVAEELKRLEGWLAQRGRITIQSNRDSSPPPRADLCIVFGGDGTLLAAARRVACAGIPMVGVNMGKLGFLADYNVEHLQKHLDDILAGRVSPTQRMMLDVEVRQGTQTVFRSPAANDAAIMAGSPFRMIELHVAMDGEHIATYMGDGVVVATPTGSTGYTLSAGGPILEPDAQAIALTPVAPHSLSLRPIVLRSSAVISISAASVNPGTTLVVDGQVSSPLAEGQEITIRQADCKALVVPHPGRTFFARLTEKLQWAQSPHHPHQPPPEVR